MRVTEHQHNSAEQVREYLAAAILVVQALEIPPELREVAFAKAVELCSAKQLFFEQPSLVPNLRPH